MSEQTHTIIDLSRLPIGTHRFDIQLDSDFFANVEKSEILRGNVSCKAVLNLREEDYQLTITVQGTVFVVCDRCLDPMPIDINANDEGEWLEANGESLDLSWLAYEIVSINIPLVHSHQAGGCNKQMDLLLQSHLCADPDPEDDKG
ncbi:MAG: hypothetical protein IKS76_06300 [Paludibacteraceae bacterium]|nr:hypothetical protein [Paludibacteraceae bacterium]MBR6492472.1 hypothetical protein [Paludibacteraceae bacterium]